MRRSAKWVGFVVVASLLVGACGGDDSPTTENSTADTTTSDTTADDGDRDRNVKVGGWGADGSGIASSVLRTTRSIDVGIKVFRRARIETINKGQTAIESLNVRDVFVTARVLTTEGGQTSEVFVVAGYETQGDDESQFPMTDFGDNGIVRIQTEANDDSWSNYASAWTVVSRDLLAVLYDSNYSESDHLAMIEYYDLRTGRIDTTYGTDGRTLVSKNTGMSWVDDLALRAFDDSGKPLFVVAGQNQIDESTEVIVAGITTEGDPDLGVGDGSTGAFSLTDKLPAIDGLSVTSVELADPGVGGADGAVGVLVGALDETTSETSLTAVVVARDSASGKVTTTASRSYAATTTLATRYAVVRFLSFSEPLALTSQVDSWSSATGYARSVLLFERTGVSSADAETLFPTSRTSLENVASPYGPIVNVSNEREFRVEQFDDYESKTTFVGVCFSRGCTPTGTHRIELADIDPFQNVSSTIDDLVVDSAGTKVLLKNRNPSTAETTHSALNFDVSGATSSKETPAVTTRFGTEISDAETEDLVERIDDAIFLDGSTMVAMRSQYANSSTVSQVLLVQSIDTDEREVRLSLPLGVSSYSSDTNSMTRIDATSVAAVASVLDSDTGAEEKRIYKVNVSNGSIDTAFGTNGYVAVPAATADDDNCGIETRVISSDGVIANLEIDFDPIDGGGCDHTPAGLRWQAFTSTGSAIGNGQSTAKDVDLGDWNVDSWTIDNQGNLYVAGTISQFDVESGHFMGSKAVLTRYRSDGSVDQPFAETATNSLVGFARDGGSMTVDSAGRIYLGDLYEGSEVAVRIVRLTTTGLIDTSSEVSLPETTTTTPGDSPAARRSVFESRVTAAPAQKEDVESSRLADAKLPANDGLTIIGDAPVLTSVKADEDRSLTISWSTSAVVGKVFVTATAMPSGRSCTSDTGSCVIRGLDPAETYTVTIAKKGDEAAALARASVAPVKPTISLKVGKIASPTTFVRPASKGKATWKVRGGCKLNETNTRLTAPKSPTTCQLSVTTAKSGSTPKTTKSVTIVVKK